MRTRTSAPSMLLSAALLPLVVVLGSPDAQARKMPPRWRHDYGVQLICERGPCEELRHRGSRYVVGEYDRRYTIRVTNPTPRWVEAVITVDGVNILDGRSTSSGRGYLVAPHDSIEVDGWRVDADRVAAFRFGSVGESYAGRTGRGHRAGAINASFFPEAGVRPNVWVPSPRPRLSDRKTAEDAPEPLAGSDTRGAEARDIAPRRPGRDWRPRPTQNLGTQYGESRWQPISERDFRRAHPRRPAQVITIRYDDWRGLAAKGVIDAPVVVDPAPRPGPWVPAPWE